MMTRRCQLLWISSPKPIKSGMRMKDIINGAERLKKNPTKTKKEMYGGVEEGLSKYNILFKEMARHYNEKEESQKKKRKKILLIAKKQKDNYKSMSPLTLEQKKIKATGLEIKSWFPVCSTGIKKPEKNGFAILAFRTLGVDVSPLLLGGSVILVGIGLGLQNLFLDFISGVIILLDRSIKVDDVVEIENVVGKVQQINIRTSTILTRDNKNMIIPNSILTKNKIVNMSYDDDVANFGISIGVGYDSDVDLVMNLMLEAAKEHPEVLRRQR
ncbi:hypothetical protein FQR65_LT18279 [Abscondita terminalis]|nr:hypothetical protein FQR65_LT18279 [Abscondita terminalis]